MRKRKVTLTKLRTNIKSNFYQNLPLNHMEFILYIIRNKPNKTQKSSPFSEFLY